MRFAVINTVPPGFCRKMHLLAPGGRLEDLASMTRDDLPRAGLSPTHMEAIEGFGEWHRRGIAPALGLLMWYLESVQLPSGGFLRTDDATNPSVGVAIRFLQIAGQLGIERDECESVDRAAVWLEGQIGADGLIRQPITGLIDHGTLARAVRSLELVASDPCHAAPIERGCAALVGAQIGPCVWPIYPGGKPATGSTALAITAAVTCAGRLDLAPDLDWLLDAESAAGG